MVGAGRRRAQDLGVRRILVGIDGSESSLRAMEFAATLAEGFDAELVAISVAYVGVGEATLIDYGGSAAALETLHHSLEEFAKAALDKAEGIARHHGRRMQRRLEFGPVRDTLLNVASEVRPDLLVVGSRGLSGLKRLLLGSVSEGVVRYADCPVLVVK